MRCKKTQIENEGIVIVEILCDVDRTDATTLEYCIYGNNIHLKASFSMFACPNLMHTYVMAHATISCSRHSMLF